MNAPAAAPVSKHDPNRPVTRHDLLKFTALVLMFIDHVGLFFFPDDVIWRIITIGGPIWMYLVGYNMIVRKDMALVAGTAIMAVADWLFFGKVLPLCTLTSILVVRLALPLFPLLMMPLRGFTHGAIAGSLMLILAMGGYYSHLIWEYGSFAFLFAGWGWWQRQAEDPSSPYATARYSYWLYVSIVWIAFHIHFAATFGVTSEQLLIMVAASLPIIVCLARFRAGVLQWQPGGWTAKVLRFCGRQTLLLYVAHFLILGIIAESGLVKELL